MGTIRRKPFGLLAALTCVVATVVAPMVAGAQVPCILNCPAGDLPGPGVGDNRPMDINLDGVVDIVDLSLFALAFGPPQTYNLCADYNCDGIINLVDLSIFAQIWVAHFTHFGVPGVCN